MFDFTVDYDIRTVHHVVEKIFKFLAALVKLLVPCSCSLLFSSRHTVWLFWSPQIGGQN